MSKTLDLLEQVNEDIRARISSPTLGGGQSPEPCLAYPKDATEQQKTCMAAACNNYLIAYIACGNDSNPAACRLGAYADYLKAAEACLGGSRSGSRGVCGA